MDQQDYTRFMELTADELQEKDPSASVCFMAIGPPEVHGPHLPLGTDLEIAQALRDRYIEDFRNRHPERGIVVLPSLPIGSDALPRPGSLGVPARTLERILRSWGLDLADIGFRQLVISDNHGGPRHLLAVESAARYLWRRRRFALVNPFSEAFRRMMAHDETLMRDTALSPGAMGDLADLHAGTNETSLALAVDTIDPRACFQDLPAVAPPSPNRVMSMVAAAIGALGGRAIGREIRALGSIARWAAGDGPGYIGNPSQGSADAGQKMLDFRRECAASLIDRALEGDYPGIRPPLWPLRILRFLP